MIIGERVYWDHGDRVYGIVNEVGATAFHVKWDDKDFSIEYRNGHPMVRSCPNQVTTVPRAFKVGDRVRSRSGTEAVVSCLDSNGDLLVRFEGGYTGRAGPGDHHRYYTLVTPAEEAEPKAALPPMPSTPPPDLSLTNEVGFPTMPARLTDREDLILKASPGPRLLEPYGPEVPFDAFLAARTPVEPEHVYREGDRVVVLQDLGRPGFLATVGGTSPRGAVVHVQWTGGHAAMDRKDLRPATAREAREGKVLS